MAIISIKPQEYEDCKLGGFVNNNGTLYRDSTDPRLIFDSLKEQDKKNEKEEEQKKKEFLEKFKVDVDNDPCDKKEIMHRPIISLEDFIEAVSPSKIWHYLKMGHLDMFDCTWDLIKYPNLQLIMPKQSLYSMILIDTVFNEVKLTYFDENKAKKTKKIEGLFFYPIQMPADLSNINYTKIYH